MGIRVFMSSLPRAVTAVILGEEGRSSWIGRTNSAGYTAISRGSPTAL